MMTTGLIPAADIGADAYQKAPFRGRFFYEAVNTLHAQSLTAVARLRATGTSCPPCSRSRQPSRARQSPVRAAWATQWLRCTCMPAASAFGCLISATASRLPSSFTLHGGLSRFAAPEGSSVKGWSIAPGA